MGVDLHQYPLSPVLCAVIWTLLSCGMLMAFGFFIFTLRFRNNRIVKMSSPNLNVLTLIGSVLAYSSGFLFSVDGRTHLQGGTSRAMLQVRMWTLCIGSTLVFGPILGKTWRLYRVFTQRVPDKRVIIRDIQLMSLVGTLILVDLVVLTAWNLTDPIRCSRSIGAAVKMVERDVSYSLSQMDSCSSVYAELWVILIAVLKGSLLLYGTYLAGLTSNVSHPPVNQSPTIITSVTLVTLSLAVVVPVSTFLPDWPNLVYSTIAGAIFICTVSTNCLLFVPQLTQWRQFEEENNSPSQMAKYFSSPSKSQPSNSQNELYYLLGENNSMKKLLNEKNAVIDSLQEQVNNAKDKLLRLMSVSQSREDGEMDSSTTNLNSTSTQTTALQSDGPSTPPPQRDTESHRGCSSPSPRRTCNSAPSEVQPFPELSTTAPAATVASPPLPGDVTGNFQGSPDEGGGSRMKEQCSLPFQSSGCGTACMISTSGPTSHCITSSTQPLGTMNPSQVEIGGCHGDLGSRMGLGARQAGFVSSEQLQEILRELSVDAALENALRSPSQVRTSRRPSHQIFTEPSLLSSPSLRSSRSPHPPIFFCYPSISPHAMRKRRPPFHSPRDGPSPCSYPSSEPSARGKRRDNAEARTPVKNSMPSPLPEGGAVESSAFYLENSVIEEEEEEEDEGGQRLTKACGRHVSRTCRCSVSRWTEHERLAPSGAEDGRRFRRHPRDSCGYWDSDSSSSTDYSYYHLPYCDSCGQRTSFLSIDSSSDSSDSECGNGYADLYRCPHPVVFKEDLKPTFV